MMKNVKTSKFDTRLCHILPFHYDFKMVFLHFLTFQQTESRDQVICLMLDCTRNMSVVCPLKTSSLDSVIALI